MLLKTKLLLAAAAVVLLSSAAQSADLSVPDNVSWSGGYIGVIGGYGWGNADASYDVTSGGLPFGSFDASMNLDGMLLGGQIGYDFDLGNNFVVGVAGDAAWSDVSGPKECAQGTCLGGPTDSFGKVDFGFFSTLRARAGITTGNMLFYATGGLAVADVKATITNVDFPGDTQSDSNTQFGWVIGAGAEFKVTENMSLGAEYLYADLGNKKFNIVGSTGNFQANTKVDLNTSIIRASFNYRF
jgi:outer membrane immunogenic protein